MHKKPVENHNKRSVDEDAPKYRQIYDRLRQGIVTGTYAAGTKLPSENELVQQFLASRPTVGRALAELASEGWIVRRAGSGTYVSDRAESKALVFGLLIPELGVTEIFEPICKGLSQARLSGHHDLLWGPLFRPDAPKEVQAELLSEHYAQRNVSGVFFAPLELSTIKDEVNQRILRTFDEKRIPVVLLDRDVCPYPDRSRYDLVGIDNRRAGLVVTRHLLENGAKRLIFFTRPESAPTVTQRLSGYRDALREANLPGAEEPAVYGNPSDLATVSAFMASRKPDAIVCPNDHTAAQLMACLNHLGIQVPLDVKITGMDDVKYASLLQTPLTTIHQPCSAIGAAALMAMLDRVERPDELARDLMIEFQLVVRKSSGSPANGVVAG